MTAPVIAARDEARETSGGTMAVILRYVRGQGGDDAVAEVLRRAGLPYAPDVLEDPARWWSYDARIRLMTATTEVLGDPDATFQVGALSIQSGLNPSVVLALRAMGSPRAVLRQVPRAVGKFSTTSTMRVLEATAASATVDFKLHDGFAHSRLDCRYAQGLLTTIPTIFGLPPAHIVHEECESDGFATCIYHLSWERRTRLRRRRTDRSADELELQALRGQLRTLQSAATELASSQDLGTVLERIVTRAAEAVLAPAYALAVADPTGGPPLVHSVGVANDEIPHLVRALLDGGDLGPHAVVVDVTSARRRHGRLAALYPPGEGGIGDDQSMLAAYAGHAAAALDMLLALEEARREADRAGALLSLAHQLAGAHDAAAVCEVITTKLTSVVGCTSAGTMLWDAGAAVLRTQTSVGLDAAARDLMLTTALRPEDVPELVGMLSDREPKVLSAATSSAPMRELLGALGLSEAVAVPLLADTAFLGVVTASWRAGEEPGSMGDVLARLRGVGDQASTALQKARLLETVRHQATHDALTGLPNRRLFLDRLQAALAASAAPGRVAVVFCDLDRFKEVNDSLGHAAGDELLRQVAARLSAAVRPDDTVGRLSGDEFAILLADADGIDDPRGITERVLDCFAEPFRLDGYRVPVDTSVGVAVDSGDDRTAEELLRRADVAMYRHKRAERAV